MTFPVEVVQTTVVGTYLDAVGRPVKGRITFRPDMSSVGEGIAVAPVAVSRPLDSTGSFSVKIPASVNTGLDPDFTYEITWLFDGGTYAKRIVQVPVSDDPIDVEDLVSVQPTTPNARFQFPHHANRPSMPQDGEAYYNTVDGIVEFWDGVTEAWVELNEAGADGPAGGVLTGTYPNPGLAANSVSTSQIVDASVTAQKLTVQYVPLMTYNADLATTAIALGGLQEQIDGKLSVGYTAPVLVLGLNDPVPDGTPAGTVIIRKTT